jgi:hypothetical protein
MGGQDNTSQGDFGEAWLGVIAAAGGMDHTTVKPDRDRVDVEVTLREEVAGVWGLAVKAQVKTERGLAPDEDGILRYRLDVGTYDFLRRPQATPRVLVVFGLDGSGERVRLAPDGTLLCGVGRWVSLAEYESTSNRSVVVDLPAENTLDVAGLRDMVIKCGVRQSTPVPDPDVWDDQ